MSTDIVIGVSASITALAALFVSIWSNIQTRKHNRLSVTPHLSIDYFHRPGEPVKVVLTNKGIGPAVVGRFSVQVDGVSINSDDAAGLADALGRLGIDGEFYAYTPFPNDALSAGETITLLSFDVLPRTLQEQRMLREVLSRVAFSVDYEGMYGDKFQLRRTATGSHEVGR